MTRHHRHDGHHRLSDEERELDRYNFDTAAHMPGVPIVLRSHPTAVWEAIGAEVRSYIEARRKAMPADLKVLLASKAAESEASAVAVKVPRKAPRPQPSPSHPRGPPVNKDGSRRHTSDEARALTPEQRRARKARQTAESNLRRTAATSDAATRQGQ
jgi:hypothetical protein